MELIRKITIGNDLLNAMNFQVGKPVMQGNYTVDTIVETVIGSYDIWVRSSDGEVLKWKTIGKNLPTSIEYNIDF